MKKILLLAFLCVSSKKLTRGQVSAFRAGEQRNEFVMGGTPSHSSECGAHGARPWRARARTDAMASESDPLRAVALEGRRGARSHDPTAREKNAVRLSFLTMPLPLPPLLFPRRLHAGRAVGHPWAPETSGAAVRYAEGRRVRAFAAPRARRRAVVSQATAGARREAVEGQRRPEVVERGGPRARRGERAQEFRLERLRRVFAVRPRARPASRPRSVPRERSQKTTTPS